MKALIRSFVASQLALVVFLAPGKARSGELVARLVRDIDNTTYAGSSHPRSFFISSHGFGFLAFGREMWRYDGREMFFERELAGRSIRAIGDHPYFVLEEVPGRTSLWVLSTSPSISYLARVREAPFRRIAQAWEGPNGLLFEGDDGGGLGLWSDGSDGPPREIARPLPFEDGSIARVSKNFFSRGAFIARDRGMGTALWRSDGTPRGTFPVFAPPGGFESILGVVGGRLLLAAGGGGPELWTSDATRSGTRPLTEIVPGRRAARILGVTEESGRVFLAVDEGARGSELWVSDGSAHGTRRLTRFAPRDPFGGSGLPQKILSRGLLFFADDGVHGREPWWSDGTVAGTRLLADLCPGPCGSRGAALPEPADDAVVDQVLFSGWTPEQGLELWQTDGRPEGTRLLAETCPGPCDGDPLGVVKRFEGEGHFSVRFTGRDGSGHRALWISDSLSLARERLTPLGVDVFGIDPVPDYFGYDYFAASDVESGEEVWTTDGTPEGTRLWADLERVNDRGSEPFALGDVAGRLLFSAFDPEHRRQLWSSDGSGPGTVRIPGFDLRTGWNLAQLATVGGVGFLLASTTERNFGFVWATDGTAAGTRRLTPEGVEAVTYLGIHAVGSRALFFAQDADHDMTIWTSDGTPEGTRLAVDPAPGPRSMVVLDAVSGTGFLRDHVLFRRRADDGRLWVTDGTPEGTKRLLEAFPFLSASSFPWEPYGRPTVELDDRLFYVGSGGLWVTNGTAEGTRLIWTLGPGKRIDQLFAARSKVYFEATIDNPETGNEEEAYWQTEGIPGDARRVGTAFSTWGFREAATYGERLLFADETGRLTVTDGTDSGTVPLRYPNGEPAYRNAAGAVEFAGQLIFPAEEGAACKSWDGIGDTLSALPGPACRYLFRPIGSKLFFGGFEPRTGLELWLLEELQADPLARP